MKIEIKGIRKNFGAFRALNDIHLEAPSGELTALLGPSGCGKTTLLRIVAGLESPDAGEILFNGADASARRIGERRVGFVFQHYALFRHMTVAENIAFGLKVRPRKHRPDAATISKRVDSLLELVQLSGYRDRYPAQLSGGQRQRVALARALAVEPEVLLLDEPFGALDAGVRRELRRWLRRLHDEVKITSLFVTHDQDEALEVADRVVIMNRGRVEQVGRPEEVYAAPASPFVYEFLGNVNLFRGRVTNGGVSFGERSLGVDHDGVQEDRQALVYVRPHEIELHPNPIPDALFSARVRHIRATGPFVRVELQSERGDLIEAEVGLERYRLLALREGGEVYVSLKEKRVFFEEGAMDYSI